MAVLLSAVLAALLPAQGQGEEHSGISVQGSGISRILAEINTLYQYLSANYLYDIDLEDVDEYLVRALMASLDDPYAEYIPADEGEDLDEDISGTYVGIGVYVSKYDPAFIDWDDEESYMLLVTSPFPGGPAERAGLRARDLISHIDGVFIGQMDADEASRLLRGEEGVPMTVTVHRGESVFDITLTPEEVTTPTVSHCMVEGTHVGYIAISTFSEATYHLVSEALIDLTAQGMDKLILDLRNNSGGTVNSACLVANFFTDTDDVILSIEYKEDSGRPTTRLLSSGQTRKHDIETVILINGGSASASEILAAALHDNGKATLVGQQSFGKGIIQDIVPWNDGYIRYTSAHYLTPNGDDIHNVGLTPDVVVEEPEMDDGQIVEYYDFIYAHQDDIIAWIEDNPDYTKENIEAFAAQWEDEVGFDPLYLKILVRNEYIASMDYEDRPLIDTEYDIYLRTALEVLEGV